MARQKEILSAQHAKDELEKNQVLAEKIKKLLIPSTITSVLCVIGQCLSKQILFGDYPYFISLLASIVWVASIIANIVIFVIAMVLGGKAMLNLMKKVAFFGWFICPFPIDIFAGIFILLGSLWATIDAPILIFIVALFNMKRENKRYNEYLKYCPEDAETVYNANE